MSTATKNIVLGLVVVALLGLVVWQFMSGSPEQRELATQTVALMDENTLEVIELSTLEASELAEQHGLKSPIEGSTIFAYYNENTGAHTLYRARRNDAGEWYIPRASDGKPRGPAPK